MDILFMAFVAPLPDYRRAAPYFGPWWRIALFAILGVMTTAAAQAQIVVGGNRAPGVSVDLTVLDGLGPAPTLPQLFGASRNGGAYAPAQAAATPQATRIAAPAVHRARAKSASTAKHTKSRRVVHRSKSRARLAHAPAPRLSATKSASRANLHLIPPGTQTVSSTRATRDQPMIAQPIHATTAVTLSPPAPAPMPKLPQAAEAPPPPVLPNAPAHEAPPVAPPQNPARDDSAPMSLVAAQPSVGQTAEPETRAAPKPAPAPAPVAAPSPPPAAPAPVQIASAPATVSPPSVIKFAPGLTDLPPASQSVLDTVAAQLIASDALRVQLVARATGTADQAMEARRVSLARAVAVRAYLIDKGVPRLRMDVRALGNRADDGPVNDQVDLLILSQ